MTKIMYEDTRIENKVNHETGEITETIVKKDRTVKIEKEPDYIKLYLQDICKLNDLPKTSSKLLKKLLKYSNYENLILLPSYIKKIIAKELETSIPTIDNSLSKLTKKGILRREGTGVYRLNPHLFGKGSWQDIKKIRLTWEYGEEGRTLLITEIEKEIVEDIDTLDT